MSCTTKNSFVSDLSQRRQVGKAQGADNFFSCVALGDALGVATRRELALGDELHDDFHIVRQLHWRNRQLVTINE